MDGRSADCPCTGEFKGEGVGGEPTTVVTLVHGTFAAHAQWVQDESPLVRAALESGADVARFCWSGANRHADRLTAGQALRDHLKGLAKRFPDARLFVVAHSHGGNVAMYAMKDEELRELVHRNHGAVMTMATPFLHVRWRPIGERILPWIVGLGCAAAAVLVEALITRTLDWELWSAVTVCVLGGLELLAFVWSARSYRGPAVPEGTFLSFGGDGEDRERLRRREFGLLELPELSAEELFVIRPTGDEASGALASAQFLTWASARFVNGLYWLFGRTYRNGLLAFLIVLVASTLMALLVGIFTGAFSDQATAESAVDQVFAFGQVIIEAVGLAFIGLLWLLAGVGVLGLGLIMVTALPFGRDGLFWPFYIQMTAEAEPPGVSQVLRADMPHGEGLGHSAIHDDPAVIKVVANRVQG